MYFKNALISFQDKNMDVLCVILEEDDQMMNTHRVLVVENIASIL